MTAFLIYIIGAILAFVFLLLCAFKQWNEITLSDLGMALICGLASWLGLIVMLIVCGSDIVIYKKGE